MHRLWSDGAWLKAYMAHGCYWHKCAFCDVTLDYVKDLKEELGDLLLQVVMQAQIAEEEGIFTMDDVAKGITEKLIRRHPHVFGDVKVADSKEVLVNWEEIKAKEKEGKEDPNLYLPEAFDEAESLIDAARKRKGFS